MISVSQATKLIEEHSPLFPSERKDTALCANHVLRENICAERENPPFHRIAMDGIAINYQSWLDGQKSFIIDGIQAAGHKALSLEAPSHCLEAMTGGVLPSGCDCVIPVERLKVENGIATLEDGLELSQWQNVHQHGSDHPAGFLLAEEGITLKTPDIAVAAAAGYGTLAVSKTPSIAIIATGDELVGPDDELKAWQIRRSNTVAILAGLNAADFTNSKEYHLKDDEAALEKRLGELLEQNDMLILTGGVSMGKFDFVPRVLEKLGVTNVFHKVTQRPGKPLWFGTRGNKTIFGLPGNPVSAVINFQRYILPQLQVSSGLFPKKQIPLATLTTDFKFAKKMTRFLPVITYFNAQGILCATPKSTSRCTTTPHGGCPRRAGDLTLTLTLGYLASPTIENGV